jgi:hypothetical protein
MLPFEIHITEVSLSFATTPDVRATSCLLTLGTVHFGATKWVFKSYNVYVESDLAALAGGAAAAAPEGGTLACPSTPTFTTTRWALVTP